MTMQMAAGHCSGDSLHHTAAKDGGAAPEAGVTDEQLLFQAGEWWPEPGRACSCVP